MLILDNDDDGNQMRHKTSRNPSIKYLCCLCSLPTYRSLKKWSLQNCSLCYWLSGHRLHKRIIFYYAYIANKFQLLRLVSITAETNDSRPRPKPQNFGLETKIKTASGLICLRVQSQTDW